MSMISRTALGLVFAALATTASAATIENGSFEDLGSGKLNSSGWNLFESIPGWTPEHRVEVQSDKTISAVDAQEGSNYAELVSNRNDTLSQDLFLATGNYELSFYYSPRVRSESTSTNDMAFSLGNESVTLTSGTIEGAPNDEYAWGHWTEVTRTFSVFEDGIYTLSFAATGDISANGCGKCGALIDNVTLTPVPLPATSLLLIAGLAGFGGLRAAKRRG